MWHEFWDTIRSNADKILDNALVLLSNTFLLVFGIHYRNHLARRKREKKELADRHAAIEEQVREFGDWMESEKRRAQEGDDSGETRGQENGVDSESNAHRRHRNRVRGDKNN